MYSKFVKYKYETVYEVEFCAHSYIIAFGSVQRLVDYPPYIYLHVLLPENAQLSPKVP
jgi:hypothetical protein